MLASALALNSAPVVPLNLIASRVRSDYAPEASLGGAECETDRASSSVLGGAPSIQDINPLTCLQEAILFHLLLNAPISAGEGSLLRRGACEISHDHDQTQ